MAKFQFYNLVYNHNGLVISATRPIDYEENEFFAAMRWLGELVEYYNIPDTIPMDAVRAEIITNIVPDPE
jgi:hypothetical protein